MNKNHILEDLDDPPQIEETKEYWQELEEEPSDREIEKAENHWERAKERRYNHGV